MYLEDSKFQQGAISKRNSLSFPDRGKMRMTNLTNFYRGMNSLNHALIGI